jgi:hypothetical protein
MDDGEDQEDDEESEDAQPGDFGGDVEGQHGIPLLARPPWPGRIWMRYRILLRRARDDRDTLGIHASGRI